MDATGAVRYLGRDDDMMNAGGYRVSPIEVERAYDACPAAVECAAVELPVSTDSSVIGLFFVPASDPPDFTELQTQAARSLARYKQPRIFQPVAALPRGANNKINRRALRDQWRRDNGHQA